MKYREVGGGRFSDHPKPSIMDTVAHLDEPLPIKEFVARRYSIKRSVPLIEIEPGVWAEAPVVQK